MASLRDTHKSFIVEQLACFDSLDEIKAALKDLFDLDVPKSTIHRYDPSTIQGSEELADKWKTLFKERRARFLEDLSEIPIANKAVRLRRLDALSRSPMVLKNPIQLRATLEQAAKEANNFYAPRPVGRVEAEEGGPTPDADTEAAERSSRFDALVDVARARRDGEDPPERPAEVDPTA